MGVIITILIIAAVLAGVIWLMRNVPSISNTILALVGVATFLGTLLVLINYRTELLEALLPSADGPPPDVADLLFNVKYESVGGEPSENQKWWTLGASDWVLTGAVINKSDKELTKLKFEVFIKYGADIIGDQAVVTQRSWKALPGQQRSFTTNSNAFKDLPTTRRNPIWGVKLVEVNNTSVKTDIVWSPDNPFNQYDDEKSHPTSKKVKTIEIIPK